MIESYDAKLGNKLVFEDLKNILFPCVPMIAKSCLVFSKKKNKFVFRKSYVDATHFYRIQFHEEVVCEGKNKQIAFSLSLETSSSVYVNRISFKFFEVRSTEELNPEEVLSRYENSILQSRNTKTSFLVPALQGQKKGISFKNKVTQTSFLSKRFFILQDNRADRFYRKEMACIEKVGSTKWLLRVRKHTVNKQVLMIRANLEFGLNVFLKVVDKLTLDEFLRYMGEFLSLERSKRNRMRLSGKNETYPFHKLVSYLWQKKAQQ